MKLLLLAVGKSPAGKRNLVFKENFDYRLIWTKLAMTCFKHSLKINILDKQWHKSFLYFYSEFSSLQRFTQHLSMWTAGILFAFLKKKPSKVPRNNNTWSDSQKFCLEILNMFPVLSQAPKYFNDFGCDLDYQGFQLV